MDLSKYLQYAAVTSPIVLAIIFLSLTFKSWLDRRIVVWASDRAKSTTKIWIDDEDFDRHVESTPGMQNLN
jgi:hypothetical protein